jgi:hypothetical protein
MGDRFRRAQIENQKRGRERAAREAQEPRLIERPDVTKTIYHIQPDDGREFKVGEKVFISLPDVNGPVVAARENERIGVIEGEGGNCLKPALADPSGPGIAELRIVAVEDISLEAIAEIIVPAAQ